LINNQLDIEVRDSVFDPSVSRTAESKVHVRKSSEGHLKYKIWVYLDGNDLPYIESVTYTLHETFRNPNRTVNRTLANPNCQLTIWTWGLFTIKATILDKKGFSYEVTYKLSYDKELPADGSKYFYEEEPVSKSRPTLVSTS
jgi:transcription initiation factor IIF auxiliary subunit